MARMRASTRERRPRIMMAVTSDISLRLMRGFPEYLAEKGLEVHVVCSPGRVLDSRDRQSGVHYHALNMQRDPAPFRDFTALLRWIRLCLQVRPDLISVGTPKAALLGGLAGWITRVPRRVYHQRGLRLETASGFHAVVLGIAERMTVSVAHIVLAVSPSLSKAMVERKLASADKITVVASGSSNGVDLEEFDSSRFTVGELNKVRNDLGLRKDSQTIGYVGRLTKDKGFDVLESAISLLQKRGITYNILIVGGVDDPESSATLARLLSSGLRVASTGSVDDPSIYYHLMDILCLPTYREGYPNVVLEASASRTATITTDATGAIDSVVAGVTGSIVARGDARALAAELESLLQNPANLRTLGDQARLHAEEHFDRRQVWKNLETFYGEQLACSDSWQRPNRKLKGRWATS